MATRPSNFRYAFRIGFLLLVTSSIANAFISCAPQMTTVSTTRLWMGLQQNRTEFLSMELDLLRAHQEMEDDMNAWNEAQAREDSTPLVGADGVYQIINKQQYSNFMTVHSDKLVILRIVDPFCPICDRLKEHVKILQTLDERYLDSTRVVVADLLVSSNVHVEDPFKEFVGTELGVKSIPSIQVHVYGGLLGNIPWSSRYSWNSMQQRMVDIMNRYEGILWT